MKKFIMAMILVVALAASACLAEVVNPEESYAGGWSDEAQGVYADIVINEDGTFGIFVVYDDADGTPVYCEMNAVYDVNAGGLVYTDGTKYAVMTNENDEFEQEPVWEGTSSGLFCYNEEGQLLWEDDREELDSGMILSRIELDFKMIAPMFYELDVNDLPDGIYPVAFDRDNIVETEDGVCFNGVMIFTTDLYDIVDINTLNVGDMLLWDEQVVEVESIEKQEDGAVVINGGYDNDGCVLAPVEESNCYVVVLDDDYNTYTAYGETDLTLAETATYTDASLPDADPVTADYAGIVEAIKGAELDVFTYLNTTIRVENGQIVEINRHYMP